MIQQSHSWVYIWGKKEMNILIQKDIHISACTAAQFTIARTWKHPSAHQDDCFAFHDLFEDLKSIIWSFFVLFYHSIISILLIVTSSFFSVSVCFRMFSLMLWSLSIYFSKLSLGRTFLPPCIPHSVLTFLLWVVLVTTGPRFRTGACIEGLCSVHHGSVGCRPWLSLVLGQSHSWTTNLSLLFHPLLLVNPGWLWLFSASALGQDKSRGYCCYL